MLAVTVASCLFEVRGVLPALRLGFVLIGLLQYRPSGGYCSEKDAGFITTIVWLQMETKPLGEEERLVISFSLQIAASHLESESLRAGAREPRASLSYLP